MSNSKSDRCDQTDSIFDIFKKKKKNKPKIYSETKIAEESIIYDMNNFKRGFAIIFNHFEFSNETFEKREGTEVDVNTLENAFNSLSFEITVCNDYTYAKIYDKIHEIAEIDHSGHDCLVIVVLSHGEEGKIYAHDHAYSTDLLWQPFSGDKCASLAGKPKMFFIQACRGEKVDSGVLLKTRSLLQKDTSAVSSYSIPVMADILVMYSTYEGYYSWRNPDSGSWFIQCLCEELNKYKREKDLMAILTRVNRRMAMEFESYVPDNPSMDMKKQIGSIVSTFTRLLYFYPSEDLESSKER